MSEQNIIPSAPPLYPKLNGGDYRLKKISDCQKELENEITHYRRISKKYKRAKTIINAFAITTGALTTLLTTGSLATLLSAIAAPIGASMAGIAALIIIMGITSTATGVSSERLNARVTKHEKTVSLAESKHLSISRLVSKAMSDGSISDVEFNLILREIDNYYSLKGQLRREVKIETISSGEKVDAKTLGQEIKKKNSAEARIPYRHKQLRIEFEKRERGFSFFISRDKFIS